MKRKTAARLVGISMLFFFLVNYPILAIWGKEGTIFSVPRLVFSIFFLWGLMIAILTIFIESSGMKHSGRNLEE